MKFPNDHVVLWSSLVSLLASMNILEGCFNIQISEVKLTLELVSSVHFNESTVCLIKQSTDSVIRLCGIFIYIKCLIKVYVGKF